MNVLYVPLVVIGRALLAWEAKEAKDSPDIDTKCGDAEDNDNEDDCNDDWFVEEEEEREEDGCNTLLCNECDCDWPPCDDDL